MRPIIRCASTSDASPCDRKARRKKPAAHRLPLSPRRHLLVKQLQSVVLVADWRKRAEHSRLRRGAALGGPLVADASLATLRLDALRKRKTHR